MLKRILSTCIALAVLGACSEQAPTELTRQSSVDGDVPGTLASVQQSSRPRSTSPSFSVVSASTGNLVPVAQYVGKVSLSIDGVGTNAPAGLVQVEKHEGATVRAAYLAAAPTPGNNIPNGAVQLDGQPISWTKSATVFPPYGSGHNVWADVTAQVKAKVDALPAGRIAFSVSESNTYSIDGEVLAVVFDDPTQTTDNTVTLLFGGLASTGDDFVISTNEPINTADPNLKVNMSLGIGFSYQPSGQFSIVDVNGQRLTSSAGGQDDGEAANGALLTVGGLDDSDANPSPYASDAGGTRTDDELYNLIPFITNGSNSITVHTQNPSNDDNVFFAAFFMTVKGSVVNPIDPPPAPTNNPPVANAGADQNVSLNGSHTTSVALDGAASTDDGLKNPLTYTWSENGSTIATGATPSVTLGLGSHDITLTVNDGELSATDHVVITVTDPSPPTVTAHVAGTQGSNGWYVSDVAVSFTVTDLESDVTTTGCDNASVTTDTDGQSFTCSAQSAGGSASASASVKRDATNPVVAFAGNAGSYTVDAHVTITCSATDATSGVASSTCPQVDADAYTLSLGSHTLNASATDNAGNNGSASATFSISANNASVCALVNRWVSQHGIANAWCQQLNNGAYGAFQNAVRAQSGKAIAADKADVLIALARTL